jgi:hypothetical protein
MKFTNVMLTLSTLALGIASAASSHTVSFYEPVWVGATQLKAGDYTVEMQGDKAVFKNGGKKVAEVPATLGSNDQKYKYTSFSSAASKVKEIDLGDTKSKIVFAPDTESASATR